MVHFQTIVWGGPAFLSFGLVFWTTKTKTMLGSSTHSPSQKSQLLTVAPIFLVLYAVSYSIKGFEQLDKKNTHNLKNQDWAWNTCGKAKLTFTELPRPHISLRFSSGCRSPLCYAGSWQWRYKCPSSLTSQVGIIYGAPASPAPQARLSPMCLQLIQLGTSLVLHLLLATFFTLLHILPMFPGLPS